MSDDVPPDPNNPSLNENNSLEIVEKNIKRGYFQLYTRQLAHEISVENRDKMFVRFAREQAAYLRPVAGTEVAYRVGEVFRTAQMWREAENAFRRSLKEYGTDPDRRANDSLRLALCLAKQGNTTEAIALTKGTFSAPPGNKPPILLAVYLEIAPALEGQVPNSEIATLIREAVQQHRLAVVVRESEAGQQFEMVRDFHINKALRYADKLDPKPVAETGDSVASESKIGSERP